MGELLGLSLPLLSGAIGLAMGSFLNVVAIRGMQGESIGGRSRCVFCHKRLEARELIPLVSFLFQKGRCRSCGIALSWQYPIGELGTALIYGIGAWYIVNFLALTPLHTLLWMGWFFVVAAAAIVIILADIRFQIIPLGATLVLLVSGLFSVAARCYLCASLFSLLTDFAAAAAAATFFFGLWFFSRGRWMGFGDVTLIGATSLLVGWPAALSAILFAIWAGGVMATMLLAAQLVTLKARIPFGPFIIVGALLAYFFSDAFLSYTGISYLLL